MPRFKFRRHRASKDGSAANKLRQMEAAQQQLLQEQAGNISPEGFNDAIDSAAKHAGTYGLEDLATKHLHVAQDIANQLPTENRDAIEAGFAKVCDITLDLAEKRIRQGDLVRALNSLNLAKEVAANFPGIQVTLQAGVAQVAGAALDRAEMRVREGDLVRAGNNLNIAEEVVANLPPAQAQAAMHAGLKKVFTAASQRAETRLGEGDIERARNNMSFAEEVGRKARFYAPANKIRLKLN